MRIVAYPARVNATSVKIRVHPNAQPAGRIGPTRMLAHVAL
jgi:hypothetical protein